MTDAQGLALLGKVARAKPASVSEGRFGPLVSFTLVPHLQLVPSVLESGLRLLFSSRVPGGSLVINPKLAGLAPVVRWFERYVAWFEGERWAELEKEAGAIENAPPRVESPGSFDVRGTAMRLQEALLGSIPLADDFEHDELLNVLEGPFFETETELAPTTEQWVLLVGMLDEPGDAVSPRSSARGSAHRRPRSTRARR